MPNEPRMRMDHTLAEKCRKIVFQTAEKYDIPPVFITAHVRSMTADRARFEVWRYMLGRLGMTRQMIADIFGRDRRRIRASVIGKSHHKRKTGWKSVRRR